ncbi:hypothetical protein ABE61_18760 [Lysinibacillus sphaericus]|uniref:hypothetical protein n=1 Tax=Lysinibacillus sphaericus TaxID=1421 RepID=UPI0018CC835C|nr:hypothetical protein [Lysinibacillus sphaericus]MBG9456028.1 hypothetical protein [Lysinibacillus sphaericus]MBG9479315.1 hypothetical protein [Lysinibacillus sphaericus]MBG9593430.1 hypothetical protein [Lysinibacillus sphaericus]
MRDSKTILKGVFDKGNIETNIATIKKYFPDWTPTKKQLRSKKALEDKFMEIENLLDQALTIQDLLETAAIVRTQGFPVYTYSLKVNSINKWEDTQKYLPVNCKNYTYKNKYQMTIQDIQELDTSIKFELEVKEYNEAWKYGALNVDGLSGLLKIKVSFDKTREKLSIHAGNEIINDVCKEFIKEYLKWPLETYLLKPKFSQASQIDNADFITALVLDFVYNRLSNDGFEAKFEEIKFKNNSKAVSAQNAGIKNVTLNGKDIISSQLACEYVTMGSSIERFKLEVVYKQTSFKADFTFKGKENNHLKIVIYETGDLSSEIMDNLQAQYIDMCINGIKDLKETNELLAKIRETFIKANTFVYELVEELMSINNELLANLVGEISEDLDDNSLEKVYNIAYNNEVLLQAIGISEQDSNLKKIYEITGADFEETEESNQTEELEKNIQTEGKSSKNE